MQSLCQIWAPCRLERRQGGEPDKALRTLVGYGSRQAPLDSESQHYTNQSWNDRLSPPEPAGGASLLLESGWLPTSAPKCR